MLTVEKTPRNVCFRAGLLGALVMTIGMALVRSLQPSPLNMELALGGLLTTGIDPMTWVIGFFAHLLMGGTVGLVYFAGFRAVRRSNRNVGAVFGLLHWAISGFFMGIAPAVFSVLPELMPTPYFFAWNFGPVTVASNLILHVLFGAIVGEMYGVYVRKQTQVPITAIDMRKAA